MTSKKNTKEPTAGQTKPVVKSLPKTPGEMPNDLRYDCKRQEQFLRNALVSNLEAFDYVEITYEQDESCKCSSDEPSGTWRIVATKRGREFVGEYKDFTNALWFVLEHSEAEDDREYEEWKSNRAAALAKLTRSERRILGVHD